jgi:endonuclease/exonuclease/phosphatase family metal-dependent hydrolase
MKIASFNVENMFRRAAVLDQENWQDGKPILEAYAAVTGILEKDTYTDKDAEKILELMGTLGLLKDDESKFAVLRKPRGQLLSRHRNGSVEVIARGRGDWIGWLELKREAVDEVATRNTAAVVADIDPDILAVVEAEDRPALVRFNEYVLPHVFKSKRKAWTFEHVMLIDGNDERGIDVGLFTKNSSISEMRSHVDDRNGKGERIFSRDCAEYEVEAGGKPLLLMVNHFKSKGYGKATDNDARRKAQAERVAELYKARRKEGYERIVVLGDFNDTPDSNPLKPLLDIKELKDVSEHPSFDWGARHGTFGTGNEKIDYILLSPELFDLVKAGGVNRKGVWHGPRTKEPWEMLPTLSRDIEAASDHAAVWVELEL